MNQSKLQIYTSIAEIVSAFAIVISLLYAGYEFRHSSTLSSREVDVLLFERSGHANRMLIETPGLAEIVLTGRTNPEKLSAADWLRFETYQRTWFNTWEIAWYHHDDGILDEVTWIEWNNYFELAAQRRNVNVWSKIRIDFQGDFRTHVDEVMGLRVSIGPDSPIQE